LSPNPASSRNPSDPRTSAALDELIDNWTNEEFDEFVRECEREVDKLELVEGTDQWERAEEVSHASLVSGARMIAHLLSFPTRRRSSNTFSTSSSVSGPTSKAHPHPPSRTGSDSCAPVFFCR
jgi:hypothetical protein